MLAIVVRDVDAHGDSSRLRKQPELPAAVKPGVGFAQQGRVAHKFRRPPKNVYRKTSRVDFD